MKIVQGERGLELNGKRQHRETTRRNCHESGGCSSIACSDVGRFYSGRLALLLSWLVLTGCVTAFGQVASGGGYGETLGKWRTEREAKLKAEDGWLTVSGLFWLREGTNDFGGGPTNDIVLPAAAAPERIGTFDLQGGRVRLLVVDGVGVTIDGKLVREYDLGSAESKGSKTIVQGDLSFQVLRRGDKFAVRFRDKNSVARRNFTGLRWYPARENYRVTARFEPYDQPKEVPIINLLGDIEKYHSPGLLRFTLNGVEQTLEPVASGEEKLFIIFRDLTSNRTTYPAGRFLYVDRPRDGVVTIDFNQAINPPCAFTLYATCPLPPRQNRLTVAIEAGELTYHNPSSDHASAAITESAERSKK